MFQIYLVVNANSIKSCLMTGSILGIYLRVIVGRIKKITTYPKDIPSQILGGLLTSCYELLLLPN